MKTVVVIISVIAVAAAIIFLWSRPKRPRIKSFWDAVRNPDAMLDLDEYHNSIDDATDSLSGSPGNIAKLVDYFVFDAKTSQDAWTELRILAKLGDQTYPRALEILRDPSLKERLTVLTEHDSSLPEGPINRICELFGRDAPPPKEATALLAPYLDSESAYIRKSIAITIGSIASAESIPDIRRALSDKDNYVRSYALMGISRAIKSGRIEESNRDEFFEIVANMWPADTSFEVCDSLPRILLQLDRERATQYLLSEDLFSVRFLPVWRILRAFNAESVEVPRSRLLTIIADASVEPLKYPMENVLADALPLLGRCRNQEDLVLLERLLDHSDEKVSRGASDALRNYYQFDDLIRDPWAVIETSGWDSLTVAEKHVLAIQQLNAEVNNGGFAQYYFNSSSEHWQDAESGLAAIGAEKRHKLMLETIEKFGNTAPAVDRKTRASQLSKIVRKKEDPFNEQDNAWYKLKDENLDRLIFKYTLANLDGLRKTD